MQYSAVQYSAVQCSTVQYSAVQYSAVQYSAVQCSTVQYLTSVSVSALESSGRTVTTRVALGARFSRSRSYSSSFSDRAVEERAKRREEMGLRVIQGRGIGTQFAARAVCPMKDDFKKTQSEERGRRGRNCVFQELHRQVPRSQVINMRCTHRK